MEDTFAPAIAMCQLTWALLTQEWLAWLNADKLPTGPIGTNLNKNSNYKTFFVVNKCI